MATVAMELTAAAVFCEDTLEEYVDARLEELRPEEVRELVTLLAAVSAGTYEAWASDTDQDVREMLASSGLYLAVTRE